MTSQSIWHGKQVKSSMDFYGHFRKAVQTMGWLAGFVCWRTAKGT